jgi:hypothetical protein
MRERYPRREPGEWARIRQQILERDHRTCQACWKPGGQVHHIVERARGGSDHPSNLMVLCGRCHVLVSPVPDWVMTKVWRIHPKDLPAARALVRQRIARWVRGPLSA